MENELTNWLTKENKELEESRFEGERLPSLQFEENKITTFTIDFSQPFDKWVDPVDEIIKKIIPVLHEGERKNLWLNIKNPLYSQIIKKGVEGVTEFKVFQSGSKKDTRYTIIE